MASNLYCPECGENLGKDTENFALAYCDRCGEEDIYNERGDIDELTEEELQKFKAMKRKRNSGRIIRRW